MRFPFRVWDNAADRVFEPTYESVNVNQLDTIKILLTPIKNSTHQTSD